MLLANVTEYFDSYMKWNDGYKFMPSKKFLELWEDNKEVLISEGIMLQEHKAKRTGACSYYVIMKNGEKPKEYNTEKDSSEVGQNFDERLELARMILKTTKDDKLIKELYPEYFINTKDTEQSMDEYNTIKAWIDTQCITRRYICSIPRSVLYCNYKEFCYNKNYNPLGKVGAYNELREYFNLGDIQKSDGRLYFTIKE